MNETDYALTNNVQNCKKSQQPNRFHSVIIYHHLQSDSQKSEQQFHSLKYTLFYKCKRLLLFFTHAFKLRSIFCVVLRHGAWKKYCCFCCCSRPWHIKLQFITRCAAISFSRYMHKLWWNQRGLTRVSTTTHTSRRTINVESCFGICFLFRFRMKDSRMNTKQLLKRVCAICNRTEPNTENEKWIVVQSIKWTGGRNLIRAQLLLRFDS